MRFLFLVCSTLLVPVCLQQHPSPIYTLQQPFSAEASESHLFALDRKQRKVFDLKLGSNLGVKQSALNIIFGIDRGTRPPPPPPTTTTEEVPEFGRTNVKLYSPVDLFQIFYRITNSVSKLIGSVVLNVADRKQQLVEAAKPFIAAKLGLDVSAASFTTQEPIESLVPRLGPPLGGDSTSTSSPPPTEDGSANSIDCPSRTPF